MLFQETAQLEGDEASFLSGGTFWQHGGIWPLLTIDKDFSNSLIDFYKPLNLEFIITTIKKREKNHCSTNTGRDAG